MSSWLQAGEAWNKCKEIFLDAALGLHYVHGWLDAANSMISMISNSVKHCSLSRGDKVVSYAQSYLGKATDSPHTC